MVLALTTAAIAHADWQIYQRAQLRNNDGISLRFDSMEDRWIRIWLIFPRGVEGAQAERPPLYRIDENPVHDLKKRKEVRYEDKNHRWLYWTIHRGDKPYSKELQEFLNGEKVIFQFYLPDGMIKETEFYLNGLEEAIEEIYK